MGLCPKPPPLNSYEYPLSSPSHSSEFVENKSILSQEQSVCLFPLLLCGPSPLPNSPNANSATLIPHTCSCLQAKSSAKNPKRCSLPFPDCQGWSRECLPRAHALNPPGPAPHKVGGTTFLSSENLRGKNLIRLSCVLSTTRQVASVTGSCRHNVPPRKWPMTNRVKDHGAKAYKTGNQNRYFPP